MDSLFSIENAQCRIGGKTVFAVERFAVHPGQHWCVYGRNGSGKTLLANLIAGKRLESASYVHTHPNFDPARDLHIVSFEEQKRLWERDNRLDISEFSSNAQDLGTVVGPFIRSSRNTAEQNDALFEKLVGQLALETLLEKGIRFLSSGQIRKVLIARSLYAYRGGLPQLLILDDPLESIDRDSRERIESTIGLGMGPEFCSLQLCRREGDMLPGISHMALMRRDSDRIHLSRQGTYSEVSQSADYKAMNEKDALSPHLERLLPSEAPSRDAKEELIRLESVDASYGELKVLDGLTWSMNATDHVVIEGPNGCGKSTLLSLIDGENHKAYGQQVYLFGRLKGSGETIWETKKNFGVVSNELHNKYIKGWRVVDVVVSGFFDSVGLYDEGGSGQIEAARAWLEALGLEGTVEHYYHTLSFGQQRLVLLARAMVKSPRVLILDEPCVGLDDSHRKLILEILDLISERSLTNILYVTHVSDEQPRCINQLLRFVEQPSGGYRIEQSALTEAFAR